MRSSLSLPTPVGQTLTNNNNIWLLAASNVGILPQRALFFGLPRYFAKRYVAVKQEAKTCMHKNTGSPIFDD